MSSYIIFFNIIILRYNNKYFYLTLNEVNVKQLQSCCSYLRLKRIETTKICQYQ